MGEHSAEKRGLGDGLDFQHLPADEKKTSKLRFLSFMEVMTWP
jgi:hypothetical protein